MPVICDKQFHLQTKDISAALSSIPLKFIRNEKCLVQ